MKLGELLTQVSNLSLSPQHPAMDLEVKGLTTNSHACQPDISLRSWRLFM
jgi:UDP-N-acetylmuramoyl-L-alanyl-D-glutamate--2,6-diaminopimelate ligase